MKAVRFHPMVGAVSAMLGMALAGAAQATNYSTKDPGGNWSASNTWDSSIEAGGPHAGDFVTINHPVTHDALASGAIDGFTISPSQILTIGKNLSVGASGAAWDNGTVNVDGATLEFTSGIQTVFGNRLNVSHGGRVTFAGDYTCHGSISVADTSTLAVASHLVLGTQLSSINVTVTGACLTVGGNLRYYWELGKTNGVVTVTQNAGQATGMTLTGDIVLGTGGELKLVFDAGSTTGDWIFKKQEGADSLSALLANGTIAVRGACYTVGNSGGFTTIAAAPGATYTLTYDGNGNMSGTAPTDGPSIGSNMTVVVKGAGSLANGAAPFAGWNKAPDGSGTAYSPGDPIVITSNTTLYAQWGPVAYTKTAIADGDWNTGTNWSPAGVPGSGDTVLVSNHAVTAGTDISFNHLYVLGGASLNSGGFGNFSSLSVDAASITSGWTMIRVGAFVKVSGGGAFTFGGDGNNAVEIHNSNAFNLDTNSRIHFTGSIMHFRDASVNSFDLANTAEAGHVQVRSDVVLSIGDDNSASSLTLGPGSTGVQIWNVSGGANGVLNLNAATLNVIGGWDGGNRIRATNGAVIDVDSYAALSNTDPITLDNTSRLTVAGSLEARTATLNMAGPSVTIEGNLQDNQVVLMSLIQNEGQTNGLTLNGNLALRTGSILKLVFDADSTVQYWGFRWQGTRRDTITNWLAEGRMTYTNVSSVEVIEKPDGYTYVYAVPEIGWFNLGSTNVSSASATAYGTLEARGQSNATVKLYWATNSLGKAASGWLGTNILGSLPTGQVWGVAGGLKSRTPYYCRFYATNSVALIQGWSDTICFTTAPPPAGTMMTVR